MIRIIKDSLPGTDNYSEKRLTNFQRKKRLLLLIGLNKSII